MRSASNCSPFPLPPAKQQQNKNLLFAQENLVRIPTGAIHLTPGEALGFGEQLPRKPVRRLPQRVTAVAFIIFRGDIRFMEPAQVAARASEPRLMAESLGEGVFIHGRRGTVSVPPLSINQGLPQSAWAPRFY